MHASVRNVSFLLIAGAVVCSAILYTVGCTSNSNSPTNPNPSTLACRDSTYMLKTSDGGRTWRRVTIHGASVLYKRMADLAIGGGGSAQAYIQFVSDDSTVCHTPPTTLNLLDVEYADGATWICSDAVYKSSDFGAHWSRASVGTSPTGFRDLEFGEGGVCLVCSNDTIYRSTDLGQTWSGQQVAVGYQDQVLDIQFINSWGNAYAITRQGIFMTMNNGQTWMNTSRFTRLKATYSDDVGGTTVQVAVGDTGRIMRSESAAGMWELVSDQGVNLAAVTTNGAQWFAVGHNEIWTGSADARTWTVYTYPDAARYFYDITFFDQNNGVIVGL